MNNIQELMWKVRLKKFPTFQGAGHFGKSIEENEQEYQEGFNQLLSLINDLPISEISILEIGCGIGWHAEQFKTLGVRDYTCIDITDILFSDLKKKLDLEFIKLDITKQKLNRKYDLILMLDVTQHITDSQDFSNAMRNIKSMIKSTFIVTSWLSDQYEQVNFYEVKRPLSFYEKEFEGYKFSKQLEYRDKWVFKIEKN